MRHALKALALVAALLLIGVLYVRDAPPAHAQGQPGRPFNCVVPVSTATTIQTVGGDCLSQSPRTLWVTDILFASSAAAGTSADSFPTLKYGTGTTCGTGTTIFWGSFQPVTTTVWADLTQPIMIPPGSDICWIMSTAGSKFLVITGFSN